MSKSERPVELLRDSRGVYGIGVSREFDATEIGYRNSDLSEARLILRTDCLSAERSRQKAVLQKITGGFRRGPFHGSIEEQMRGIIHHAALGRSGLPWPGPDDCRWWSKDIAQQNKNRATYHGLRLNSLSVINKLIGAAIEEAANQDAIKMARRFTFRARLPIYEACARSVRARQLAETFPALALHLYAYGLCNDQGTEALRLVEAGARLRDVAEAAGTPIALRHVKPGAAHLLTAAFARRADILAFLPRSTPRQRLWLEAVRRAGEKAGEDYAQWCAKNAEELPGQRLIEIAPWLDDVGDWVNACKPTHRHPQYSDYSMPLLYHLPPKTSVWERHSSRAHSRQVCRSRL